MFHCCNECFTEMDVNRQVDEEEKKDRASALNEALMALMRASTISLPSLTFNEPMTLIFIKVSKMVLILHDYKKEPCYAEKMLRRA